MSEPGSEPLRPRLERYAECLAREGTQLRCWCQTADNGPLRATKGRQVSATRAAAKVADRVLYLKREIAKAKAPPEALDPEQISTLMRDIGQVLLNAARTVAAHGHEGLALKIRKSAITHCGRTLRTAEYVPEATSHKVFDLDAALTRISVCDCA